MIAFGAFLPSNARKLVMLVMIALVLGHPPPVKNQKLLDVPGAVLVFALIILLYALHAIL